MVITHSAPRTAWAIEPATAIPVFAAALREASDRSKPLTAWPAFTRLAAIGPPMLPSPIKAIFVMLLLLH